MRCEEFVKLLEEEGDGLAPEASTHAASCAACGPALERWRAARRELREMAEEPAPPFLSERVMAAVRAERAGRRQAAPAAVPWRMYTASTLAALAVVALGGWALWQALHGVAAPPREARNAALADVKRERGTVTQQLADKTEPAPAAAPPLPAPAASAPPPRHTAAAMHSAQARHQAVDEARPAAPQPVGAGESVGVAEHDRSRVAGGAVGGVLALEKAAPPAGAVMAASADRPRAEGALTRLDTAAEAPSDRPVTVRLTRSGNTAVSASAVAPEAAPPPGIVWRVVVATHGTITLRDAEGHDIGGSHAATMIFLRTAGLAPGEYRLSR